MFTILISILAGAGAGFGTGLAGMSAAAIISPMLVTFLGIDAYSAIGIALASDVLASAASAYTYKKHGNIDLKNGIHMMIPVLIFTLIGSLVSSKVDNTAMGALSVFSTFFLGMKFLLFPVNKTRTDMHKMDGRIKTIKTVIGGVVIGSICGFMGAGGGIMMLLILTTVLGYELKTAVGTSVFIMTFTALTGATSHFIIVAVPDLKVLVVCALSTLVFARVSAMFANRISSKKLNRIMGVSLSALGLLLIAINYFL